MPEAAELPVIEPDPDDGVGAVTVGLIAWAVAGVICFAMRERLAERGADWWLPTCLVGLGWGLILLVFTRRRARVYRDQGQAGPSPDA